jgi:dTMP kinase
LPLSPDERLTLDEVARAHVRTVLAACRGNRTNAARVLGVDRKTLARHLRRWGMSAPAERHDLHPGSLIAIEGLDGSGITTQAQRLVDHLARIGHPAIYTREPSAGPVGKLIRELLGKPGALPAAGAVRTFSLLFAADRVDHFHRVVAPALANGTTVVSDRWYHSSLAYQRTTVDREWIATLNRHTRTPDLTVVLEVAPETGQRRRAGRTQEYFHDLAVQREVAAGYRATIAELRAEGESIVTIDAERSVELVAAAIVQALGIPLRK